MEDRELRIERIKELIRLNKKRRRAEKIFDYIPFAELVEALGEGTIILSDEKSEEIYLNLLNDFPFVEWGRIEWSKVGDKWFIDNLEEVYQSVSKFIANANQEVFILWGYIPVIQTTLEKALKNIEEVREVGSDQWIYALDRSFVIELYHEGEIVIGLRNK